MIRSCPTPLMKQVCKRARTRREPYRNPPWMAKSTVSEPIKKESSIRKKRQKSQLNHEAKKNSSANVIIAQKGMLIGRV